MAKRSPSPAQAKRPAATGQTTVRASSSKTRRSNGLLLAVMAGVLVVGIGLVVLISSLNAKPITATTRVGEGTAWGPVGAPVTLVEYSDFGCHYCKAFAESTGEQLRAEYEATGKVRFEFKHFIVGGQSTRAAAAASECAADQGKFWDYHDVLFGQQGTSADPFTKPLLKRYAAQLGLDSATFDRCVDSDAYMSKVVRDNSEGSGRGVNATPTFFVGGQSIQGAQPYAEFKKVLDAAIAAAG